MLRTAAESAAAFGPRPLGPALTVIVYVIWLSLAQRDRQPADCVLQRLHPRAPLRAVDRTDPRLDGDQTKSFAVGLLLVTGAASLIYFLIRWSPTGWWLPAGLAVRAADRRARRISRPLLLLPLFYRMKPLDRESLRARLLALAERAGARVLDAYEWGLSGKTKKANAALTGLGATRRILVSDTMLAEYSDEEIEIVLAHELAHHVHGDIWKGLAFESALLLAGFRSRRARWAGRRSRSGFVVPPTWRRCRCCVLAAGAVSLVMVPIAHAMSRAYERRADRFALELTNNPSPSFRPCGA